MKKTLFIALAACAIALAGCKVVSEPEPVAVESVTLNATTLTLAPGATGKLTATVTPDNADDKKVVWLSSDLAVATVGEDGTVTARKEGTANITAHAGGIKAECAVIVHTHSYSNGKCTVCGLALPSMAGGTIDENGKLTKYTGSETAVVIPDGVTSIEREAFYNCTSLESVEIPASVTSIGTSAFFGCASLASVEIPDGVTSIGRDAFYGCTSLASVEIPGSVKSIGWGAFSRCASLASVEIPDSVTSIVSEAFSGCTSLESVEIPASVTSIGLGVFQNCTSLASVEIPDSVTSIGNWAFYGCASLASVEIPASVTSIGNWAFKECESLTDVTYTGTLAQWCALSNDKYLMYAKRVTVEGTDLKQATTLAIPDSVTYIGSSAFYGCTSLTNVTIPDGVTSIGNWTFFSCTSLERVTYAGTKDDWGDIEKGYNIFYDTKVTQITDKDGVTFTVGYNGNITK